LKAALSADVSQKFSLRPVDCMAGCERPATVGFQAAGKATYLFGDIESPDDIRALAQFAQQYLTSDTGWTCAGDRPAALYDKTLARIPARSKAGAA
jgi:predicted metal-binding protein